MKRVILMLALALLLVPVAAMAGPVADFGCIGGNATVPCSGTVTNNSGTYVGTGINLWNGQPYGGASPFVLAFNSSTHAITISGTGGFSGQNLVGTITAFQVFGGSTLDIAANWTTLPSILQTYLGASTGVSNGSVHINLSLTDGNVVSADIPVTTPEPASLGLLATGLLGLGASFRRKIRR